MRPTRVGSQVTQDSCALRNASLAEWGPVGPDPRPRQLLSACRSPSTDNYPHFTANLFSPTILGSAIRPERSLTFPSAKRTNIEGKNNNSVFFPNKQTWSYQRKQISKKTSKKKKEKNSVSWSVPHLH